MEEINKINPYQFKIQYPDSMKLITLKEYDDLVNENNLLTKKYNDIVNNDKLLNFIKKNMYEDDYDRNGTRVNHWYDRDDTKNVETEEDINDKIPYEEFIKNQELQINKLDNSVKDTLFDLIRMIEDNEIKLMDKESMLHFNCSGFCFDSKGKLILFNEC